MYGKKGAVFCMRIGRKIEVFVLKYYLKEKLGIEFVPRTVASTIWRFLHDLNVIIIFHIIMPTKRKEVMNMDMITLKNAEKS